MHHYYRGRGNHHGGNTLVGMILGAAATVGAYFLLRDRLTTEQKDKLRNWMRQGEQKLKDRWQGRSRPGDQDEDFDDEEEI